MAKLLALTTVPKVCTTEPSKKKRERTLRTQSDALDVRLRKVEFQTILSRTKELLADVQEASTVSGVAAETWGEDNEIFRGVLDLLDHKLGQIEQAAKSITRLVGVKGKKAC